MKMYHSNNYSTAKLSRYNVEVYFLTELIAQMHTCSHVLIWSLTRIYYFGMLVPLGTHKNDRFF